MRIAVAEGDGIGHEVIPIACRIVECFAPGTDFLGIEVGYGRWERTGTAIDEADIEAMKSADAVLFGAVTTPPDPDYQSVVLKIRHALDLYANVRPVKGEGFDIVIVRENTEGLYSGIEWREPDRAYTVRRVTRAGTERIARYACCLAARRSHLCIGNKANVIKSDVLFRDVCLEVAAACGVPCTTQYIDALALDVLMRPHAYDVIVTTNIFGDILSDVAAYLVGGLGMLASANVGARHALFEPVHGSAPDIAGKDLANPVAAVRTAALLLEHQGICEAPALVEQAVQATLARGIATRDLGGSAGTEAFGDALLAALGPLVKR